MAHSFTERVPIEPIADLIREWHRVYAALHEENSGNEKTSRMIEPHSNNEGMLNILAFQTGVSARVLRRIKSGKYEYGSRKAGTFAYVDSVPFDIADKIVCGTVGPLAWHTEPLNEFYGPLTVKPHERHLEEVAA